MNWKMRLRMYSKKWWVWAIVLAVVLISTIVFAQITSTTEPEVVVVEKRDVIQEVLVTGRVEPTDDAELAFERGGVVERIYARVGERVPRGGLIMSLNKSELNAEYLQASAQVKAQEAKLAELMQGTRPEEIEVQRVKVANAEVAVRNEKDTLLDELSDAFTDVDDAVRRTIDQFFDNPQSSNPQLSFTTQSTSREILVEQGRLNIERTINEWLLAGEETLEEHIARVRSALIETRNLLEESANLLSVLSPSSSLTTATIDGWRSDVSTARNTINSALSGLTTAEESYEEAQRDLVLAREELVLKEAGTVPFQITAQEAALEEAQAKLATLAVQLNKMTLRAPFAGIITKLELNEGELANAQEVAAAIIGDGVFEIIANVPEADIAKVHLDAPAHVTLDAYGDEEIFEAYVSEVDPAETIIDGVATYKVTLLFSEEDERVRSGMTADTTIVTGERMDVIAIPARLVRTQDFDRIVSVLIDGVTKDRVVKTGLRGADGYVEIKEGLEVGELVVRER